MVGFVLFVGIKVFFRIWFTHAVTFLIWIIAFFQFDLGIQCSKHLTPNTSTITQDLFPLLQLSNGIFLWHMIPASLTPKLFQRSKHKKKIKKKKTSKESRKILEYEMMNNENSSPFILGYVILHIEDKNIAWVLFGTMSYHIFLSYDLSLNFSTTMFQA